MLLTETDALQDLMNFAFDILKIEVTVFGFKFSTWGLMIFAALFIIFFDFIARAGDE